MADFVDNPLPLDISLGVGVKKYVDVSVLCFDDRLVNEYGYLFFELDANQAIEFCIFGNVCPPEDGGRHFPASYSVNVWSGDSPSGMVLYEDVYNVTGTYENGDFYAEPLCFALPDTEGEDEYYFEITLRNSDEYGDVEERVIRAGVVTDDEVRNFFDGDDNLDYYHFREGCDGEDNIPVLPDPQDDAVTYKSCLKSLNGTESIGFAYFNLQGNQLTATVVAANMVPNEVHPQHIHGFEDDSNSTCPPESAADNDPDDDDRFISIPEGAPFYGGVLLSLTEENGEFPIANSMGFINYQRTFSLGEGDTPTSEFLGPLENRAVVLHGINVDGTYQPPRPAACGPVELNDH